MKPEYAPIVPVFLIFITMLIMQIVIRVKRKLRIHRMNQEALSFRNSYKSSAMFRKGRRIYKVATTDSTGAYKCYILHKKTFYGWRQTRKRIMTLTLRRAYKTLSARV